MQDKEHDEEDYELPLRKRLKPASPDDINGNGRNDRQSKNSLASSSVRSLHFATTSWLSDLKHPGSPGIFFESQIPALTRTTMIGEVKAEDGTYISEFHDSESEDIYDLYNACNGVMFDGFLDVRRLDELSQ